MKKILFCAALSLSLSSPTLADEEEGFDLMEEGARLILRGLLEEIEPTVNDLEGLADELRPALRELAGELRPLVSDMLQIMDDVQYYHGPEILDNGDVIFRRRDDAPPFEEQERNIFPGDENEVDTPAIEL